MVDVVRKKITIGGVAYEIELITRPFREGVEVQTTLDGELLRISEQGLGERAAIEKLKSEILKRRSR